MTFQELQTLGMLRGDIELGGDVQFHSLKYDKFGYVWMQTQDSKATAFSRLLFAMRPWYAREPRQLDGLRVATVADPVAVSRAWALELLLDAPDPKPKEPPKINRLMVNQRTLDWARTDPQELLAAARSVAAHTGAEEDNGSPDDSSTWSLPIPTPKPSRRASSCSTACSRHARKHSSRPYRF